MHRSGVQHCERFRTVAFNDLFNCHFGDAWNFERAQKFYGPVVRRGQDSNGHERFHLYLSLAAKLLQLARDPECSLSDDVEIIETYGLDALAGMLAVFNAEDRERKSVALDARLRFHEAAD